MIFVPGTLVALLTFPGVICHEYAHYWACKRRRVRVLDVVFFRLGDPAGYVEHERIRDHGDAFWVATAPFFVNSIAAILVILIGASYDAFAPRHVSYGTVLSLWLGVSLGMHAFPSKVDANTLWRLTRQNWKKSIAAAVSIPIVFMIYVGHYLTYLWFDLIYSILLVAAAVLIYSALPMAAL